MSQSEGRSREPRAIIHKQILDIAKANPDASLEEIAEEVTGATSNLVDRVLQEYGDPDEELDDTPDSGESSDASSDHEGIIGDTMSDAETKKTDGGSLDTSEGANNTTTASNDETGVTEMPTRANLSEKQVDTLRLIEENPTATQRELAEELDVTAATVSRRLNDISGFAWDRRQSFASRIFTDDDMEGTTRNGSDGETSRNRIDREDSIEDLRRRIETLERQIEDSSEKHTVSELDIDLLHKMIHACMASENITEEEELQILDELIGGTFHACR